MGNQTPGKILRILLEEGEKSRQELAVRMEMSVPAISQNIGLLERRGLARDGGMFDSTGGRKARIVSPVPDARYAIGLDVTENRLSGVLIDLSENIVEERQRKLRYENSPEYGAQAGELVRELLSARPRASEKTLGVGVSLPGILAHDRNTLAYSHILRVGGVPKEQFARTMELPIALVNDAKAAAIAECSVRRERGNAVYLSLSATVGGAVVLNGHVQEGNHQHSGEFGHMTLVPDGRRCYCGQYGCVDAYCACGSLTGGEPQGLDAFFAALDAGDPASLRRWQDYARHLATVINNLQNALDSPVILGGFVGAALNERRLAELRALTRERSTFTPADEDLTACRYRRSAAAVGAAILYVEPFLESIESGPTG